MPMNEDPTVNRVPAAIWMRPCGSWNSAGSTQTHTPCSSRTQCLMKSCIATPALCRAELCAIVIAGIVEISWSTYIRGSLREIASLFANQPEKLMGMINKATTRAQGALEQAIDAAAPAAQWMEDHGAEITANGEKVVARTRSYITTNPLQA